jgi:hypothetical protein
MKSKRSDNKVPPDVDGEQGHLGNDGTQKAWPIEVNYNRPPPCDNACPPADVEDGTGVVDIGELLNKFGDVNEGWNSRAVKGELHTAYNEWLARVCSWKNFLTLTFKEYRSPDLAYGTYIKLVHVLNERLFGDHYTRIVHHSYFNYLVGIEFTRSRSVCHMHALTDRPMDYTFIHAWWYKAAGICWIEQIKSTEKTLRYVTKYVCKGGDENIKVYLTSNHREPRTLPEWWIMD